MKLFWPLPPKSRWAVAALAAILSPLNVHAAPSGVMGPKNTSVRSGQKAVDAPFLSRGHTIRIGTYRGHPLMIWEVATWCGSCRAGLKAFADHQALIDKSDLKILVLRDYKNGGYPGITIRKFAKEVAPRLLGDPHFVFGNATQALATAYNPRHYVDIYQLVTQSGKIAAVSSTPSVTFKRIETFVQSSRQ